MNTNVSDDDDGSRQSEKKPRKKRWLLRILILLGVGYFAILGFLAANETYLVFPGSSYPKGNWTPENFAFEEVEFQSADGTKLVGWFLPFEDTPSPQDGNAEPFQPRTILVCHGNGENVSQSSRHNGQGFRNTLKANVFEFDYRGFGKSQGAPFEEGVLQDAEAALDWVCEKTGTKPAEVIIVGHSIGGGPAVYLASTKGCKVLVLQRTFTSLPDAAQIQYPWLPVSWVMRNRFPSEERIKSYNGPLFQSHGDADTLIPVELGKRLHEAAPNDNKYFLEVPGMTHWDPLPSRYWTLLVQFVEQVESDAR